MPGGERKKIRKEKEEPGASLGARCNDNAFCRMTDSFHIAGGCIADAWLDAWIRPRTTFPYYLSALRISRECTCDNERDIIHLIANNLFYFLN